MTGKQGASETYLTGGIKIETLVHVLVDKRREGGREGKSGKNTPKSFHHLNKIMGTSTQCVSISKHQRMSRLTKLL